MTSNASSRRKPVLIAPDAVIKSILPAPKPAMVGTAYMHHACAAIANLLQRSHMPGAPLTEQESASGTGAPPRVSERVADAAYSLAMPVMAVNSGCKGRNGSVLWPAYGRKQAERAGRPVPACRPAGYRNPPPSRPAPEQLAAVSPDRSGLPPPAGKAATAERVSSSPARHGTPPADARAVFRSTPSVFGTATRNSMASSSLRAASRRTSTSASPLSTASPA